jgi:RNase P subunit RPR2
MACVDCTDAHPQEILDMLKNNADALICKECKNNTFNTRYKDDKPVSLVCRNCGVDTPLLSSSKKKKKNETIDSEV